MKDQVKTPVIVVAAVAVIALLAFFGMKAMGAGDLDRGQVEYTPGKPPWEETDPNKKGPGGAPGGGGPGAPPVSANGGAAAPPGYAPPALGGN